MFVFINYIHKENNTQTLYKMGSFKFLGKPNTSKYDPELYYTVFLLYNKNALHLKNINIKCSFIYNTTNFV